MDLGIDPHLVEERGVTQWSEKRAGQDRAEADDLSRAIVKSNLQRMRSDDPHGFDAMEGVVHGAVK